MQSFFFVLINALFFCRHSCHFCCCRDGITTGFLLLSLMSLCCMILRTILSLVSVPVATPPKLGKMQFYVQYVDTISVRTLFSL
jgi:hypothetical protein